MAGGSLIGLFLILIALSIVNFFYCFINLREADSVICSLINLPDNILGSLVGLIFGQERSDEAAGFLFLLGALFILISVGNLFFRWVHKKWI